MSLKVLVADPDWRFAQQVSLYLESHAHLAIRESQTDQAIDRALRWRPDLVIASTEFVEEGLLEPIYKLNPRPAVLLTGWMDRYDRVWRAWQRGGDELLMKPVLKSQDLHWAIVTALENASAGARPAQKVVSLSA